MVKLVSVSSNSLGVVASNETCVSPCAEVDECLRVVKLMSVCSNSSVSLPHTGTVPNMCVSVEKNGL